MRTKTVEYSNKKSKYLSGFLILHWFFKYLFCLVRTEIPGRRRVHFAGIQENSNTLVTKSYQNSSKIDWRGVLLYVPPPFYFWHFFGGDRYLVLPDTSSHFRLDLRGNSPEVLLPQPSGTRHMCQKIAGPSTMSCEACACAVAS